MKTGGLMMVPFWRSMWLRANKPSFSKIELYFIWSFALFMCSWSVIKLGFLFFVLPAFILLLTFSEGQWRIPAGQDQQWFLQLGQSRADGDFLWRWYTETSSDGQLSGHRAAHCSRRQSSPCSLGVQDLFVFYSWKARFYKFCLSSLNL